MSLKSLIAEAGVSLEDVQPVVVETPVPIVEPAPLVEPVAETPLVEETVVNPIDAPSASVPVADVVVSTEEPVVAPVAAPPVTTIAETEAAVAGAEIAVVEANGTALQSEQTVIQQKADELLDIQTAMESISQLIRRNGALGISNQTAEAVQIQMRDVNRRLGIESPFVSIESFKAKDSREQHNTSRIALESIKTASKVALNKFIALIERLIAIAKKMVMNFYDGIAPLQKQAAALEKRLGAIKVTELKDGTIQLPTNHVLVVDGALDVAVSPEVLGLAHFTCNAYPEAVVKYLDNLTKGVLRFDPEDGSEDMVDAMLDQYAKPLAFLLDQKLTEDTLPGGYEVEVGETGLNFGLKKTSTEGGSDTSDYPIPEVIEIRRACRDVVQLLNQIKEARSEVDAIGKASDKLVAAVKRVTERASATEDDAVYSALSNKIGVAVSQANPRVGEIVGYIVRYAKNSLDVMNRMADAIEKSKQG